MTGGAAHDIVPDLFPPTTTPTSAQIKAGIEVCLGIQRRAVTFGKRPFASCLVGPDNETVLLMHQSIDQVNHAEVRDGLPIAYSKIPLIDPNSCFSVEPGAVGIFALFESFLMAMYSVFDVGTLWVGHFKTSSCPPLLLSSGRMCSATIYWAHIGRIVYAATNDQLAELTGPGNKENFTMK